MASQTRNMKHHRASWNNIFIDVSWQNLEQSGQPGLELGALMSLHMHVTVGYVHSHTEPLHGIKQQLYITKQYYGLRLVVI